jgi:hypothetical protein
MFLSAGTASIDPTATTTQIRGYQSSIELTSAGLLDFWRSGTSYINLNTNGSSFFNGGNIGIGTTTPTDALHVYKNSAGNYVSLNVQNADNTSAASHAILSLKVGGSSGGDIRHQYSITGVGTWYQGIDNSASDSWNLDWNHSDFSAPALTVLTGGNVGIGTTAPTSQLHITSGATTKYGMFKILGDQDIAANNYQTYDNTYTTAASEGLILNAYSWTGGNYSRVVDLVATAPSNGSIGGSAFRILAQDKDSASGVGPTLRFFIDNIGDIQSYADSWTHTGAMNITGTTTIGVAGTANTITGCIVLQAGNKGGFTYFWSATPGAALTTTTAANCTAGAVTSTVKIGR